MKTSTLTRTLLATALVAWVSAMFWEIATLRAVNIQNDIFASDLLHDRLPTRAFVGASLRRGDLPFWMPGIYTGFPALAQVEIGSLYPSNLLLFGVFSPYVAIAYAQLLPLIIVGVGAAFLALEYRLAGPAALLAGGSLALSGFFVCHIRQLNMIDAACWLPWLLLRVERSVVNGSRGSALAFAALWWVALLAGHPQVSFYSALVLIGYYAVRSLQVAVEKGVSRGLALRNLCVGRTTARLAAGAAIGTVSAAAALLPAIELSRLTRRGEGLSYEAATAFPVSPESFWSFFVPYVNGDVSDVSFRLPGIFWEQYGYLGLLPMLLAILAVVSERRDGRVLLLLAIVVVSYLMVLGGNTPLFFFAYHWVPGMAYFRFPTRFLLFVELGIALLAAFGLSHLIRSCPRRSIGWCLAILVLGATAVDLWTFQRRQVPIVAWERWTRPVETVEILQRAAAASDQPWRYFSLETKSLHAQVFHLSRGWSGDLSHYIAGRDLLQPSHNLLFALESPDGYANLVPLPYEAIWGSEKERGVVGSAGRLGSAGWEIPAHVERLLRLFNVRFLVSAWPLASQGYRQIGATDEGVLVYEVPDALPRAFVVGRLRRIASDRDGAEVFLGPDFSIDEEALVSLDVADLPMDAGSSANVRIVERDNDSLTVEADLERPGMLLVSESHYPGWRVRVDGENAPIVRANLMMRGVALSAGRHEVRFEFRSSSFLAGFLLSALGVSTWIGALVALKWSYGIGRHPGV